MSKWHVSLASEVRVAGYDSEWADMDNPQGAILVNCIFLVATDQDGRRYVGPEFGLPGPLAEFEVGYWQERFDAGDSPADSNEWQPSRPAYGSLAYEESGQEQTDAFCERRDDPFYLF